MSKIIPKLLFLLPLNAFAQGLDPIERLRFRVGGPPVETLGDVEYSVVNIVDWIVRIFWIVAVAMIIWAAFLYLTAGGDEEKVKEAKKRLLQAVIAAAIALLATGIDIIVFNLLIGVR